MNKKILLGIVLLLSVFMVTGCETKTPLEPKDFVDLIEQNDVKSYSPIISLLGLSSI